jgi:hypothetical protein
MVYFPHFVAGSSLTAFEQTAGPFVKRMKNASGAIELVGVAHRLHIGSKFDRASGASSRLPGGGKSARGNPSSARAPGGPKPARMTS